MNAVRLAAAALLMAGAYAYWSRPEEEAGQVSRVEDITDAVSETVGAFLGVDMPSTRYTRALADPANAEIIAMLTRAESKYGIPSGLLVRQAWQESRFNPGAVNARSGAKGLMQFMPATAAEWGVQVFDAASSADGGGRYMQWLYGRLGSWPLALAAYNWGIGNVMRKGTDAAPTETKNYVSQIFADLGLIA